LSDNQDIVDRLTLLETDRGIGGAVIAKAIGLDQSQYSKIKRRKIGITLKQVMEISSKFGVRTGWLIEGELPIYRNEKSGSLGEPDIDLLTLMKKQTDDLKINFDRLFSHMSEHSSENADQDLLYPSDDLTEDKKKKAGKS
jgi:transcriptional regulator with XRE-family HTH domain